LNPTSQLAAAESLAAGMPKLLAAAERLAFVTSPGLHGRRRAGAGESFWQFRDWRDGDDSRRIDWRRSAQGERLYLREREREAQASFALQFVSTAGMDFHSHKTLPRKRDRAILLLLALASLLLRAGERVSLAGVTPPLAGNGALIQIAQALLKGGAAPIDPRARRIVFGDFLTLNPQFVSPPGGAVIQILDPAECDFPYTGRTIFEGFDAAAPVEAGSAAAWREIYLNRLAAQRQAVTKAAMRAGQVPIFHRTDATPASAVSAFYQALQKS
jgi:uncharacterized protein (DUF58 family)